MSNSTRRLLLANYLGQGWSALANIAFIPIYVSLLGAEAYGLVGVYAILVASLSLIDAAVGPTMNRAMSHLQAGALHADRVGNLMRSMELVCIAVVVVAVVAVTTTRSVVIGHWLGQNSLPLPVIGRAMSLMAACASLRLLEGLYRGALLGLQRHVVVNLTTAAMATIRSVGSVAALSVIAPTIDVFFVWQLVVSIASVLSLAILTYTALPDRSGPRYRFSASELRTVSNFASGVFITSAAGFVLTQVDKIMLSSILPLAEFGYYSLAVALAGVLYQLAGPVTQAFFPKLTSLLVSSENAKLTSTYHDACQLISFTVVPAALILVFGASELLLLWSRSDEVARSASPVLRVLAFGTMLHCLTYMPYMLQLAAGWSSLSAKINVAAIAFFLPLLFYVVPRYGAMGAALVWVLLNTCYVVVTIPILHSAVLMGELRTWYFLDVGAPVVAAAVSGLICFSMHSLLKNDVVYLVLLAASTFFASIVTTKFGRQILGSLLRTRPSLRLER